MNYYLKNQAKETFHRLGILDPARVIYGTLRSTRPANLYREFQIRQKGPPDGWPIPPSSLIFLVIGTTWKTVYWDSGKTIAAQMTRLLENNGIHSNKLHRILDFGCGCGRILRHLTETANRELHGSDYNPLLVKWCQEYLPFADFRLNHLTPPLSYDADYFDFIYLRSVFTHLGKELQKSWMQEFWRILQPGGILYFSTAGKTRNIELDKDEIDRLHKGDIVVRHVEDEGKNMCLVYESPSFVQSELLNDFELITHVDGLQDQHAQQDIYLVRKKI
jgi:SAM-dependent methyltransferase